MNIQLRSLRLGLFGRTIVASAALLLFGCQSTPQRASTSATASSIDELTSTSHLDLQRWKRTPDCCSASGSQIAISSEGHNSTDAGMEIHKEGGNAVDIAVATAFTLCVERAYSVSIGGGGFMTLHLVDPKFKGDYFVDFRETAPKKAKASLFMGKNGEPDFNLSQTGGLAVATPGIVAGLFDLHARWGKLPWKKLLQPAIRLANEGFPIYPSLADRLASEKAHLATDPYLSKIFFKDGKPLAEGESLVQKDLAETLTKIADHGKKAFYYGPMAAAIAKAVDDRGGVLSVSDLRRYKTKFPPPVKIDFGQYELVSTAPPSSGGVVAAQVLSVLSTYDLAKESQDIPHLIHLVTEALKRGYADRSEYIGDPDFFKKDYKLLLTPQYIEQIRAHMDADKATPSAKIRPGEYVRPRVKGTSDAEVMDAQGNAVSLTISTNGPFGASVGVPGYGITLNNTMDDFTLKAGERNMWGVVTGGGNLIEVGKRPLSSMMPTIVLSKASGLPVLAVAGNGGSRIISSVIEVIINDLYVLKSVKKAVFAPRFHHQWIPEELVIEGFSDDTKNKLAAMGYKIKSENNYSGITAVGRDANDKLEAVSDPRDEGGALAE